MMLIYLIKLINRTGQFFWSWNYTSVYYALLSVLYLLSGFWAVDHSYALWGFLKFLPLALFAAIILQDEKKVKDWLTFLPEFAAALTILSILGSRISATQEYFLVDGRLAGTFQYPNTFAVFLLLALIYALMKKPVKPCNLVKEGLILLGILYSGSRTVFVILPFVLVAIVCLCRESKRRIVVLGGIVLLLITAFIAWGSKDLGAVQRIFDISLKESSLLGRILYAKDALPVILEHPFGLGYMGYYFLQGSFQTGVYTVVHIHNEFLQTFLDIGWIPGLAMIGLFFYALWKNEDSCTKLMLTALMLHCLVDFDLQFIGMDLLLMLLLPWKEGKSHRIRQYKWHFVCGICLVLTLGYFMIGNALVYLEQPAAERFWPKNTLMLVEQLKQCENAGEMNRTAEKILRQNQSVALAWDAKARIAFVQGDVETMMQCKRKAISLAKYAIEEYTDYLDMLFAAEEIYRKSGDTGSAQYCLQEAVRTEKQLELVKAQSDELAWKIQDQPELELPERYRLYFDEIYKK